MRAIIYARVSTEEQEEKGYSLNAQVEACENYAKSRGWEVVMMYKETGSGKKAETREKLMRALSFLKEGGADMLIVWRLDRLTRSIMDFQKLVEDVGERITSVTEGLDMSTSTGRFVANLLVLFAQYERESIVERTKLGIQRAKKEGKRIGRKRTIPENDRKRIKMLRSRGFTYKEIAERTGYSMWSVRSICERG